MQSLQSAAAASNRVFEFLDEPELRDESSIANKLVDIKGMVEFKNVQFGYDESQLL